MKFIMPYGSCLEKGIIMQWQNDKFKILKWIIFDFVKDQCFIYDEFEKLTVRNLADCVDLFVDSLTYDYRKEE